LSEKEIKNMTRPLPQSINQLLNDPNIRTKLNPGLYLDKFADSFLDRMGDLQQRVQLPTLQELVKLNANMKGTWAERFEDIRQRQKTLWNRDTGRVITGTSLSPMALHLARASSLENGSVCFHPIYGFAYIPGSGLKGLTYAYAIECWLPNQDDFQSSLNKIRKVFGFAPSPLLRKRYQSIRQRLGHQVVADSQEKHDEPKDACVGEIVFHDAWPTSWPELIVDILNNHHTEYYRSNDENNPPGDWENPIPVYFPAIKRGAQFEFAIMPRRRGKDDESVRLATEWLAGGITQLGVGGKTNAGYGMFQLNSIKTLGDNQQESVEPIKKQIAELQGSPKSLRKEFACTLSLVTPAFFAGANQEDMEGCDLRPATLRGQLRWWWRTMHAAYLSPQTLKAVENVIWGDTNHSGSVQVFVHKKSSEVLLVPGKQIQNNRLVPDGNFFRQHEIALPGNRLTPGLFYASFGMDDKVQGDRRQRYVSVKGEWQVRFAVRRGAYGSTAIDPEVILGQIQSAMWLLTRFGGVGAKSRRGFGSLADVADLGDLDLEKVKQFAGEFRNKCGLPQQNPGSQTASLESAIFVEGSVNANNPWKVLDFLGTTLRDFSQSPANTGHGKHCHQKAALGLPRKIHGPRREPYNGQVNHKAPESLAGPKGNRHASPLLFHVGKSQNSVNTYIVRATIFPNSFLWSSRRGNPEESSEVWQQLGDYLTQSFLPMQPQIPSGQSVLQQNDGRVRVRIVEYIRRTDQYSVIILPDGTRRGLLLGGQIPSGTSLRRGDEIEVIADNAPGFYRWPQG
jgi:CRISPR-associated protein Cmr6